MFVGEEDGSYKVLNSFRSFNKLDASERCITDTVLHPPCTELGLCILQFEKHVVIQYLDLIKTTKWKNYVRELPWENYQCEKQ